MRADVLKTSGVVLERHGLKLILLVLTLVSIVTFIFYHDLGLTLAYNDARSHLDIGRRVVEGLTPGLAQLGSVWLPLPHFLMIFTVWSDFMWHSGLAGSVISMASYVATGIFIWLFLKRLNVSVYSRFFGVFVFAFNTNILYLQSTAMTELLLILTLTAAIYEIFSYFMDKNKYSLVKGSFWIMASTLVRYEGWFLFAAAALLIFAYTLLDKGKKAAEGMLILYMTLSGFGIFMWLLWNQVIFGDFLYFAFGPFSAHAQQDQLEAAGDLLTKGNFFFSGKIYYLALYHCIGLMVLVAGFLGAFAFVFDRSISFRSRIVAISLLFSPIVFNVLALFFGHSVVFVEGVSGKSWFNIRYGVMFLSAAAIFGAYLADKAKVARYLVYAVVTISMIYSLFNLEKTVTVSDALYGSSGKDVSQIAGWIRENVDDPEARVLVSAASHDAVIFSSGLQMKQIIHEGTGPFWETAIVTPDRWARYIVMRTNDVNDSTFRLLKDNKYALEKYDLAYKGNFADIYVLKSEFAGYLSQDFSLRAFGNWREKKSNEEQEEKKNETPSQFSPTIGDSGLVPGAVQSLSMNILALAVVVYIIGSARNVGGNFRS